MYLHVWDDLKRMIETEMHNETKALRDEITELKCALEFAEEQNAKLRKMVDDFEAQVQTLKDGDGEWDIDMLYQDEVKP